MRWAVTLLKTSSGGEKMAIHAATVIRFDSRSFTHPEKTNDGLTEQSR